MRWLPLVLSCISLAVAVFAAGFASRSRRSTAQLAFLLAEYRERIHATHALADALLVEIDSGREADARRCADSLRRLIAAPLPDIRDRG